MPEIAPRFALSWTAVLLLTSASAALVRRHWRGPLLRLDHRMREHALDWRYAIERQPQSDRVTRTWFFRFWTNFASAPSLCVLSVALAVAAHGVGTSTPRLFYLPGLCFLGSMGLSWVTKRVFRRPRPAREAGAFGHKMRDGSFPSGHSITAFCFWFALAWVASASSLATGTVAALCLLGLAVVGLTGLSRVYLGVHFPTDVLGGYAMGALWLLACLMVLSPPLRSELPSAPALARAIK